MATPAVSVAGSVTSERVVAAVTAVIVGSAGVGVLAAAKLHRPAPPKPPAAVSQVTPHVVHIVTVHRAKARRRHNVKRATEAPAIPVPVSTWSPCRSS